MTDGSFHFPTETCRCLQDHWPLQLRWATAGKAAPVPGPGGRPVLCYGRECQFDSINCKRLFCLLQCFWHNVLCHQQDQSLTHCSFCIFLIKTLDKLLPKDRTEVCGIRGYEPIATCTDAEIPTFTPSSFFFPLCRKPSSTCWSRSAGLCPTLTRTSASLWSASSARPCWTPSWAMPHRRLSAPFCTSAKGRRLLLKVSRQKQSSKRKKKKTGLWLISHVC